MLKARWDENERLRVKREGLTEEYEGAKVEAETGEERLKKARRRSGRAGCGDRGREGRTFDRGGAV